MIRWETKTKNEDSRPTGGAGVVRGRSEGRRSSLHTAGRFSRPPELAIKREKVSEEEM